MVFRNKTMTADIIRKKKYQNLRDYEEIDMLSN